MKENLNNSCNTSASFHRRNFISALLVSTAAVLIPLEARASPGTADSSEVSLLPTPADSLSLYIEEIINSRFSILHQYYVVFGLISSELRLKYENLKKDVEELIKLAPRLRDNKEICRIKDVADAGRANIYSSSYADSRLMVIIKAHFETISLNSDNLIDSLTKWEQDSIQLNPNAVKKLREIFCQIDNLNSPTQSLQNASVELSIADKNLGEKIKEVTDIVGEAIKLLVINDPGSAIAKIEKAISSLNALEAFKPSLNLQEYLRNLPADVRQKIGNNSSADIKPTEKARNLLLGTIAWIKKDGRFPTDENANKALSRVDAKGSSQNSTVEIESINFVPSVTRMPAAGIRFFRVVKQVLTVWLPEATFLRIGSCSALLCPILALYSDENIREAKIKDLFAALIPSGEFDNDDERRKKAAEILSKLEI